MAEAEPRLALHIAEDRNTVIVTLVPATGGAGSATFTLEQLTSIIQGLGLARQHMGRGQPSPPPLEGQHVYAIFGTSWYVAPELRPGGSALVFEHPCFGPVGQSPSMGSSSTSTRHSTARARRCIVSNVTLPRPASIREMSGDRMLAASATAVCVNPAAWRRMRRFRPNVR